MSNSTGGTTRAARVRAVADALKSDIGDPGVGFALLAWIDGAPAYASNADRADVRTAMREWLSKVRPELAGSVDVDERPEHVSARQALESKCARIAIKLSREYGRVALFLFNFGPPKTGSIAWKLTGDVNWKATIAQWSEGGDGDGSE